MNVVNSWISSGSRLRGTLRVGLTTLVCFLGLSGLGFPSQSLGEKAWGLPGESGYGPLRVADAGYEVEINANGSKVDKECRGGDVVILGEHNQVRLRGAVGQLIINGDANLVRLECTPRAITVNGSNNKINYLQTKEQPRPRVDVCGENNQVVPH